MISAVVALDHFADRQRFRHRLRGLILGLSIACDIAGFARHRRSASRACASSASRNRPARAGRSRQPLPGVYGALVDRRHLISMIASLLVEVAPRAIRYCSAAGLDGGDILHAGLMKPARQEAPGVRPDADLRRRGGAAAQGSALRITLAKFCERAHHFIVDIRRNVNR